MLDLAYTYSKLDSFHTCFELLNIIMDELLKLQPIGCNALTQSKPKIDLARLENLGIDLEAKLGKSKGKDIKKEKFENKEAQQLTLAKTYG